MEVVESTNPNTKILNVGLLLVATPVAAKLKCALIMPRTKKRLPPTVSAWPVLGGLVRFMKGPGVMLREEYPKLGSVFTLKLLNKNITFLIGPQVSAHFFKAPEYDLSQQEVYQFNVPTFGPGVVFDVDHTIRQEQSGSSPNHSGLTSSRVMLIRWLWKPRCSSFVSSFQCTRFHVLYAKFY